MKHLAILIVLVVIGINAIPLPTEPTAGPGIMAQPQNSSEDVTCHCPTHEQIFTGDKTYVIDCSSDEKTAQKFHNQSKIIISSQVLVPKNAGTIVTCPSKSYHLPDWDSPVETPPPRV